MSPLSIIRNACENDAPELLTLLSQLGYSMSLTDMKARLLAFQAKNHQIFVAEQAGLVVGVLALGCYEQFTEKCL